MYVVPKNSIDRLEKALKNFYDADSRNVLDRINDVISAARDVDNCAEEYKEEEK
jgi:hypothetical protein